MRKALYDCGHIGFGGLCAGAHCTVIVAEGFFAAYSSSQLFQEKSHFPRHGLPK
jgi:hypothetical protein